TAPARRRSWRRFARPASSTPRRCDSSGAITGRRRWTPTVASRPRRSPSSSSRRWASSCPDRMAIDPYRTLGLLPGASAAEVKRAYRRLAKAFHPDSAGPDALPRFLAIHEAYERLIDGQLAARVVRPGGAGGAGAAGAPRAGTGAASEPWRADPSRARAAREQARARTR